MTNKEKIIEVFSKMTDQEFAEFCDKVDFGKWIGNESCIECEEEHNGCPMGKDECDDPNGRAVAWLGKEWKGVKIV